MNDSQDSGGLPARLTAVFLFGVIGVAAVGYFVGINDGVPRDTGLLQESSLAVGMTPDGSDRAIGDHMTASEADAVAGDAIGDGTIMAVTYRDMRRADTGPTSGWKPSIDQIPQPTYDLYEEFKPSEEQKQQSTLTRASRRAFNGAPPIIPHVIERTDDAACYACHGKGMRIDDRVANQMSHPFLANCTQCHAAPAPKPFANVDASVDSSFVGLPAPSKGDRAFPAHPDHSPFDMDARYLLGLPWSQGGMGRTGVDTSLAGELSAVPRSIRIAQPGDYGQPDSLLARDLDRVAMTDSSRPPRRDDLSRRDFVQGKFWRAFGWMRSKSSSQSLPADEQTPREKPPLGQLVMRYPKTLDEVAAGNGEIPLPDQGGVESGGGKVTEPAKGNAENAGQGETLETARSPRSSADLMADMTSQPPDVNFVRARHRSIPILRPPGAIDEASFLERCTRCGDCIKACPHDAIVLAPPQLRNASGTPMLQPDHQPCLMCKDLPCIDSCEDGVLSRQVPVMMGTAKITEHLCLAYHGTTCTVCSERCPVPNAITVDSGKSVVNEATCTGCGVCRYVCPAPENAILLMPTFLRPNPSRSQKP